MPLSWRFSALGDRHRALGSKLEDWSGMGTAWPYDKDIYEEHIASLSRHTKLRLLTLIATKLETAAARTTVRLQDLSRLGRDVWEGTSADDYVRELRGEWQARE